MKKRSPHSQIVAAVVVLAAATLLLAGTSLSTSVSARVGQSKKQSLALSDDRRIKQGALQVHLSSANSVEFRQALTELTQLDEPGALDVWQVALKNSQPELQRDAWSAYSLVQAELSRKQFIPQIAYIDASTNEVLSQANRGGFDVTIWSAGTAQTVAAVPPYLIENLRHAGIDTRIVYDSVADWQKARVTGDSLAKSISPPYETGNQAPSQLRIAVIDLANRGPVAPGYSNWLGDREDVLMRDGSRIAYMDTLPSDSTPASIDAFVDERYTRRGFRLSGYYTPEQFADLAPRLFPGKNFEAGRRTKRDRSGEVSIALANGKFHSYDQTLSEFKALANSYPGLARYSKLGSSFEGREIFALKISKDAGVDDSSKPDVLLTGLHHAREWISVEAPVYIANQLLSGYATDDSIRYLVDHLQIWIVPIMNPDGLTYTQASPNTQLDSIRLWRKNRRPISLGGCSSTVGVDLNRNYGYQWRIRGDEPCADYCSPNVNCFNDDIGGSDEPNNEIYRGPQPESEPEVKALKSLVDDPNRHFRAQIDYHNYNQLILYPWGYAPFGTSDANTLSQLSRKMSDEVFGIERTRYQPEQAVDLYALTGSSIDYAYGVNHVPAPFVVEMRPDCCDFSVPETQIPAVNRENWAGAQSLMNWASGPPILESVKAYVPGSDGTLSKLVYAAHWSATPDDPGNHRQLVVDTRFSGIEPGRLQVKLQFSRPMNTSLPPRATVGRDGHLDELTLSVLNETEGWQKTVYNNDTWVGETVVIDDGNLTSSWQLAISATDTMGFMLDAVPDTVATYVAGMSFWNNYEDTSGAGNQGGSDTHHIIGPNVRGDFPNVLVASPNGGERLAGSDRYTIVWSAPNAPGFPQSLSLSTDGGASYGILAENIPPNAQRYDVTIPRVSTARARVRLIAVDPLSHNFLFAASQANFSIGLNVGSAVEVALVSSEKMDLGWSDTALDDPTTTASGTSRLTINLKITNRGNIPIVNPFLRVSELTRHVLLTRDPKSSWAEGARQSVDAGTDNELSPGESADAKLVVGLVSLKKFFLSVELYGVASGGTIDPASGTNVWTGKPRNR